MRPGVIDKVRADSDQVSHLYIPHPHPQLAAGSPNPFHQEERKIPALRPGPRAAQATDQSRKPQVGLGLVKVASPGDFT